jgi:hypothetical protein
MASKCTGVAGAVMRMVRPCSSASASYMQLTVMWRRLGFGTYLAAGSDVRNGVRAALKAGIRAIDTASLYRVP